MLSIITALKFIGYGILYLGIAFAIGKLTPKIIYYYIDADRHRDQASTLYLLWIDTSRVIGVFALFGFLMYLAH